MRHFLQITCSLLVVFNIATAQQLSSVPSVDSVARFEAIPNSLAFQLLGLPSSKVAEPGTISKALASLSSFVDRSGHLATGLGVSLAPYQLWKGTDLQISEYVNSWWTRLLSNTQVSFGTAPSLNVDSSVDWAVGAQVVFLNSGDGRLDFDHIQSLVDRAHEIFSVIPIPDLGTPGLTANARALYNRATGLAVAISNADSVQLNPDSALVKSLGATIDSIAAVNPKLGMQLSKYLDKRIDAALSTAHLNEARDSIASTQPDPTWNAVSLDFNAGAVYRTSSIKIQDSKFSKAQFWLSSSWGSDLSKTMGIQIIEQLGWYKQTALTRSRDSIAGIDTIRVFDTLQADSTGLSAALMMRVGSQDFRFGAGFNALGSSGFAFNRGTMSFVSEIRVSNKIWIVASIGGDFADKQKPGWKPGLSVKGTGDFFGL
jgi:hypothetical protein